MAKPTEILRAYQDTIVVEEVAQVFENVASVQIRRIKSRVIASREFFHELWGMYSQLRLDSKLKDDFGPAKTKNQAVLLISSDSGLSGSIDERLVETMMQEVNIRLVDVVVIGRRAEQLLTQKHMKAVSVFPLPDITKSIRILPLVNYLAPYKKVTIFYERFVSLSHQEIVAFELQESVKRLSEAESIRVDTNLMYASDYIFEPSLAEVVLYLESMMQATALTEMILESRLAQLASRYTAMSSAHDNAEQRKNQLKRAYSIAQRRGKDQFNQIFISREQAK
ncbi:F0F1 ATP synthase subunit gamma [Candidatus Saccharibacteria bacterium]|nr:F0F1 ATP synthase subunit gamma [Candidatus Saccharibacteria bacterium]